MEVSLVSLSYDRHATIVNREKIIRLDSELSLIIVWRAWFIDEMGKGLGKVQI